MLKKILILFLPLVLIGCGTISAQSYTDLAIEKAVADARLEAAEQARMADRDRLSEIREAIRLWIEQSQDADGRRPHRPLGGT